MKKKHVLLAAFAAAMLTPTVAWAQYPQITDEAKENYKKMMTEERKRSDEAWAKALPIVQKEAKEGRPYIPWAGRPYDLPQADIPSFPGAEGGGMYSFGGRGGKVITVTNLNDRGPGSFREACETGGARIIVFNVAGIIRLESPIIVRAPYVTIAGQTAPGDGVCIAGESFWVDTHDVVVRHMRFRRGETKVWHRDDSFGGNPVGNIMIDHCSISWSTDECASFYDNTNFTMQWCIISESLRLSGHTKGPHGYGGIWGGVNASYHHNLMAHHDSRTPRFGSGVKYQGQERTDMRNNVIYNWSGNGCYGGAAMGINIVDNYYKPGPATDAKVANRVMAIDISSSDGDFAPIKGVLGQYHISRNYFEAGNQLTEASAAKVNKDNWTGIRNNTGHSLDELKRDTPVEVDAVTTHTAQKAYELVLKYAGCSLKRDDIDTRIVEETRTGTAQFIGKNEHNGLGDAPCPNGPCEHCDKGIIHWKSQNYPKGGLIDSQKDLKPSGAGSDWSAWPTLKSLPQITDSDNDGMPDEWETANGLNPNKYDANGRNLSTAYDNIEVYINSLVETITNTQNKK